MLPNLDRVRRVLFSLVLLCLRVKDRLTRLGVEIKYEWLLNLPQVMRRNLIIIADSAATDAALILIINHNLFVLKVILLLILCDPPFGL